MANQISFILIFTLSFLACSNNEGNTYESLSFIELDEMFPATYYDVELTVENELAFDENGTLFTGIRNTYDIDSDLLTVKTQFIDGRPTQYEFFEVDNNGVNRSSGLTKKSINEDGNLVTRGFNYTVEDSLYLSYEMIETDTTETYALYYDHGQILASYTLFLDRETIDAKRQGLFTEYDEQGNIIKQERYDKGVLIETIK